MSEQTSRLAIVLDSNSAKRSAEGLAGSLQRLTAEGEQAEKSTESLTKVTKEQAQEVAETHRRVEEYRKRLESTKTTISATAKEQDKLTETYFRQIDRVKQLGGGVKELRDIQASLRVERSAGNISQRDYLTLLSHSTGRIKDFTQAEQKSAAEKAKFIDLLKRQVAAQHLTNEEMLRARAAQLGVSSSAEIYISKLKAAKVATHGFSLETRSARQELGVMAGELLRGNFGALRGSSITLANRSGLLEQLMSPRLLAVGGVLGGIGAAAYGVGRAYYEGAKEGEEFNKQLILTGDYAGKSADQLQDLSKKLSTNGITQSQAAEALAKVVGTGAFKPQQLERVTQAALEMQRATGQAVDATIANFQKLYGDPARASEDLNRQMHYLTAAQYQYITSLEARGEKEAAGEYASKLYADAVKQRTADLNQNLGIIERSLKRVTDGWKAFWDAALNVGRKDTTADQITKLNEQIAAGKKKLDEVTNQSVIYGGQDERDKRLENVADLKSQLNGLNAQLAALQKIANAEDAVTKEKAEQQRISDEGIDRQKRLNDLLDSQKSREQKLSDARRKFIKDVENNKLAAAKGLETLWSTDKIAAGFSAITKQFAEPKGHSGKGSSGGYREDAGRRMIAQLEQQNALLAAQGNTKEKLLASEQELVKWQQRMADLQARPAAQLSGEEQSLLLNRQQITAALERNVAQEKLNRSLAEYTEREAYRQRLFDAIDNREQSYFSMAQDADRGDKYRQRQQERLSLDKAYNAQRAQLDRDYADKSKGMSRETYEANSQSLTAAMARDKASLEQHYRDMDALQLNFGAGLSRGLENWLDSASNVYSASQSLAENTFNGMSDALTDFVVSGKDSFGDFAESVLKDLTRMITRMLMFKAIETGMNSLGFAAAGAGAGAKAASSSNAFSSGAYNNLAFWHGGLVGYASGGWVLDIPNSLPKAPSFAAGGYTGAGGKYEPRGIVHGGEFVIPKEDTRRIGVDNLEAMLNGDAAVAQYRRPLDMSSGYGQQLAQAMAEDSRPNITINITQNNTFTGGGSMDAKTLEQIKMEIYKAANQAIDAAYARVYKDVATNGPIRRTLGV